MIEVFDRHMRHQEYLSRVSIGEDAEIAPETASQAMQAWIAIWVATDGLMSVPDACTGSDGEVFYSWDRGRHRLELEIIPNRPAEFFYMDRETEQLWSEDYNIGGRLPAEAIEKLRLFM